MRYLSLCDWLISRSKAPSGFSQVVAVVGGRGVWGGEGGVIMGHYHLMGTEFWKWMDRGGGCTRMWMYLPVHLKTVKTVN